MNVIEELEKEQIAKLTADRPIPRFSSGDTLRVMVKVVEGTRERIQAFEGVCIGRKNDGLNSSFTVRKISYGEGVERVFPLYSSAIDSIDVVRRGAVRRAKLYYLRGRSGKSARIAEKIEGYGSKTAAEQAAGGAADTAAEPDATEADATEADAAEPQAKTKKAKAKKSARSKDRKGAEGDKDKGSRT